MACKQGTIQVTTFIPPEDAKILKQYAASNDRSVSSVLRLAIKELIAKQKKK